MTITNHVRMIETLTAVVIEYVDDRNYAGAHSALDDISTRVRLAHEHVDHLQELKRRKLLPAGRS